MDCAGFTKGCLVKITEELYKRIADWKRLVESDAGICLKSCHEERRDWMRLIFEGPFIFNMKKTSFKDRMKTGFSRVIPHELVRNEYACSDSKRGISRIAVDLKIETPKGSSKHIKS